MMLIKQVHYMYIEMRVSKGVPQLAAERPSTNPVDLS